MWSTKDLIKTQDFLMDEKWGTVWYRHYGGACPVPESWLIDVLFRNGDEDSGGADEFFWEHWGEEDDIIGWRDHTSPASRGPRVWVAR